MYHQLVQDGEYFGETGVGFRSDVRAQGSMYPQRFQPATRRGALVTFFVAERSLGNALLLNGAAEIHGEGIGFQAGKLMAQHSRAFSGWLSAEPSEQRAARAMTAGATKVFNPTKDNIVESIQDVSDGFGAHVVFECAGVQSALDAAFAGARGKARVIELAKYPQPVSIWPNTFNKKGLLYIQSSICTRQEFQEVVDAIASGSLSFPAAHSFTLIAGRIRAPSSMVTARIPLEDAISGGFEELLRTKDKHCKILVQSDSLSLENSA